jgi:hypothetical protein
VDRKRRLPLLPAEGSPGDGDPVRPPWQWVGFGALAIFTAWLPLSAIAGAIASRTAASVGVGEAPLARIGVAIVAMHAVALALGSFAGGFLVGRWGGRGVGLREAALAGLAAALAAIGAAWATSGFSPGSAFVVAVTVPSAVVGGWRGLRARTRSP